MQASLDRKSVLRSTARRMNNPSPTLKIGIVGTGAIGTAVAARLAAGEPRLALAGMAARDIAKAEAILRAKSIATPVMSLDDLAREADLLVDCAAGSALRDVALAAFAQGKSLVTVNAAALLDHMDLADIAARNGAKLIVATGALLALDAVAAASLGRIERATMRNRKPPKGWSGAPYVVANKIDLDAIDKPTRIFTGTAREAAKGFPANVNVAAALSLAGPGPDRTQVEIWAEPGLTRNIHEFDIVADCVKFSVSTEGLPSPDNPKTSAIVPLSVLATLKRLVDPLRIGT
jgi:aspartate dehydrogenase